MQSTKTVSVLRALAAPALFSCIVSCVNEDYDLNGDIDTSVDIYGDGGVSKCAPPFFLRTKPRLSQAGALLLPKDFVSLSISSLL